MKPIRTAHRWLVLLLVLLVLASLLFSPATPAALFSVMWSNEQISLKP